MGSTQWPEDALKSWLEAQQSYWSTVTQAFGSPSTANTNSTPFAPNWSADLMKWAAQLSPNSPPQIQDVLNRVMDMGKVYLGLAEQVYSSSQSEPETPSVESWMRSLESGFEQWFKQRDQGSAATNPFIMGNSLFEGWQQLVNKMQGMNLFNDKGTASLNMPNTGLWQEHLEKALAMPSFGLSREGQARLKKIAALAEHYQQAMDQFNAAFAKQGHASVQALRTRIQNLADQGKKVNSLRELYDLWVDTSEESYAEFASSDQYQLIYGELVNNFLRLKQSINEHLDQEFKALGLPVRADYEAAIKKQYELKRENHALRQQLRSLEQRINSIEQSMRSSVANTQEAAQ